MPSSPAYDRAMRVVTTSKDLEATAATRGRVVALHAFLKAKQGRSASLAEVAEALYFGPELSTALLFLNALADGGGSISPTHWRERATLALASHPAVEVLLPGETDLLGGKVEKATLPIADLLRHFDQCHRKRFKGRPAVIVSGKDAGLLTRLCRNREGDADEVRRLMDLFFESLDPFIAKAGYSIGVFVTQAPKLVALLHAPSKAHEHVGRDLSRGRLGVRPGQFR